MVLWHVFLMIFCCDFISKNHKNKTHEVFPKPKQKNPPRQGTPFACSTRTRHLSDSDVLQMRVLRASTMALAWLGGRETPRFPK